MMLCSNSQHQANYAHCFVPINNMLLISLDLQLHILLICDYSFGNLDFMTALFQITSYQEKPDKLQPY